MMASHTTTLEQKFKELENAKETPRQSRPKIQRVPEHIRNREKFKDHYVPKLVSIGPIHHGKPNLKLGEKFKLVWAKQYIKNANLNTQNLHKKIADNILDLKGFFADDVLALTSTKESLEDFTSLDEKLSWMLFVDGCSLLHILESAASIQPEALNIKVDQLVVTMNDALLLENQLPYLVLKLLWKTEDETELIYALKEYFATPQNRTWRTRGDFVFDLNYKKEEEEEQDLPVHLLDLQRKIILTKSSSKTKGEKAVNKGEKAVNKNQETMTYRNIQDLRAGRIKLKSSETRRPTDIDFFDGWFVAKLILPEIVVDETTTATFLNLIAYEMCPDFENDYEICSFVAFMDSLIDNPEDVRELRSNRILHHCLCSDEEVANIFNLISQNLVDNTKIYLEVRNRIHKHCVNKYKTWIAQGINTYFNNPWAFIAFLAAFMVLTLTFVQTWFEIYPANK
ncbi:hypothetical protein TSUD_23260 [Trifolium subterraneum]|uniref:DUF247 domain protein n=1 Tax=Trifolium subterraneum TaxID=3900 RepID=A0A2Z6MYM4_TRISU|nr:hypothetical protein TSUD_23260 [Trifolium subterraneum]